MREQKTLNFTYFFLNQISLLIRQRTLHSHLCYIFGEMTSVFFCRCILQFCTFVDIDSRTQKHIDS